MPTLPNMTLITPTLGADRGVWDDKINACFGLIDEHDHTAGKGLAIVSAAIDIDADLPMNGYSLTTLGKLSFSVITAPSTGSLNLFVNTSDNELYWRTSAGANVKLTSGTSINTTLVGGIVGDYTSVSAQVAFDGANGRYTFKQNSATGWAKVACGDVRIYEAGTSESVYVGLKAPSALAASYDITWPLAVPGSQLAMQMSTAGVVSLSNTFTSTLVAPDFKNSSAITLMIPASAAVSSASNPATLTDGVGGGATAWTLGNTGAITFPIILPSDALITGYTVYMKKTSDATKTISARLYYVTTIGGAEDTSFDAGTTESGNGSGTPIYSKSSGALTGSFSLKSSAYIKVSSNTSNDLIYGVAVQYTRP